MPNRIDVARVVGVSESQITLTNTNGSTQTLPPGDYVAVRRDGQEKGVYQLHDADASGNPSGESIASVYLIMRSDGVMQVVEVA